MAGAEHETATLKMQTIYEPISLGFSCGVKYQLSRTLFTRKFPDGVENDFRNTLLSPEYGQRNFERHIFDWQITRSRRCWSTWSVTSGACSNART